MSATPQTFYGKGSPFEVQQTPEFDRVLGLRRRDWEEEIQHNDLVGRMTQGFKLPHGTQELRLIQAAALADAHDQKGLFAPIPVGGGKTLLSYLLPVVIPQIQRPTLLLPASLVEKTWKEFKVLQRHWQCHPELLTRKRFDACVISYQRLGRDGARDLLMERQPDILICDEVHKLRNRNAAVTKRVYRFMMAYPQTIFCGMSGSITKRSIRDYWHLLFWALREKMPLPRVEAEVDKWAEALDETKSDSIGRRGPGALLHFCSAEERQEAAAALPRTAPVGRTQQMPALHFSGQLKIARQAYQRRLRETPGVICSPDRNLDTGLQIRRVPLTLSPQLEEYFERLRGDPAEDIPPMTPNGDILTQPADVWRTARELSCGFYYKWQPDPPIEWMRARSSWNWFVRQILSPEEEMFAAYQHLSLDSPMQVALAITGSASTTRSETVFDAEGEAVVDPATGVYQMREIVIPARPPTITDPNVVAAYQRWVAVRGTYKINTVAQWVDDSMLKFCLEWMKQNKSGIVWTEHRAFGIRLAQMLGTGFCSTKGEDESRRAIEDYNGAPVVASVAANHEGRNLQAWHRNLIVTMPPVGYIGEQLIGRTHRPGQMEDTVYVDWVAACAEQDQGFSQMMADARYIQDTWGQSQKLLYADHV